MLDTDSTRKQIGNLLDAGLFRDALTLLKTSGLSRTRGGSLDDALLEAELLERVGQVDSASTLLAVIRRTRKLDPLPESRAWLLHGTLAKQKGQRDEARAAFEKSHQTAVLGKDLTLQCWAGLRLMTTPGDDREGDANRRDQASLEDDVLRAGNPRLTVAYHAFRAELEAQDGRFEHSARHTAMARSLLVSFPNQWLSGLIELNCSCVAYLVGDAVAAHRHALAALVAAHRSGHHHTLCASLTNLGTAYLALGQPSRAEQVIVRALDVVHPGTTLHVLALETLAEIWLAVRNLSRCEELLGRVNEQMASGAQQFSRWHGTWSLLTRASLAGAQSKWAESLALLDSAGTEGGARNLSPVEQRLRLLRISGLIHCRRVVEAEQALSEFQQLTHASSASLSGVVSALRASLHNALGNPEQAVAQFRMASAILSTVGETAGLSECVVEYADCLAEQLRRDRGCVLPKMPWTCADLRRPTTVYSALSTSTTLGAYAPDRFAALVELLETFTERGPDPRLCGELALRLLVEQRSIAWGVLRVGQEGLPSRDLVTWGTSGEQTSTRPVDEREVDIGSRDGERYVLAMQTHASVESSQLANIVSRLLGEASRGSVEHEHDAREARQLGPSVLASESHTVCVSQTMVRLFSTAKRAAASDVSVLITGESGSGKEVLARFLHESSRRSAGRFVPVNCPAIPKDLFDSQLFGHRKGAFTGAVESFDGIIQGAAGGTLFLDEIGELPVDVQPKLLRFLDSREIHTLGETHPKQIDVRVVAATNVDLEQLVAEGRFRSDLFYRLSVFSLHVPPLRERRDDVKPLIEKFVRDFQRRFERPNTTLSPATMAFLCLYDWPGNVRQLSSEIHRLIALSEDGEEIGPDVLSPQISARPSCVGKSEHPSSAGQQPRAPQPLRHLVDDLERTAVEQALADAGGSQTEAARRLGLSRKGLYLKRMRLGIQE